MKRLFGIVIFVLGLISCATISGPMQFQYTHMPVQNIIFARQIPVYIDVGFGDEDKMSIDNALDKWNHALNGYIVFTVKSFTFDMGTSDINDAIRNHGLMIFKVDSITCNFIPSQNGVEFKTLAWADISSHDKIYVVRDRLSTQAIFPVMLHEIGHILGAVHSKEYLMHPVYTPQHYVCIDEDTIKQVAKFNNLPIEKLNYCYFSQEKLK